MGSETFRTVSSPMEPSSSGGEGMQQNDGHVIVSIDLFTNFTQKVYHMELSDRPGMVQLHFSSTQLLSATKLRTGQHVRAVGSHIPVTTSSGSDDSEIVGRRLDEADAPRGTTVTVEEWGLLPPLPGYDPGPDSKLSAHIRPDDDLDIEVAPDAGYDSPPGGNGDDHNAESESPPAGHGEENHASSNSEADNHDAGGSEGDVGFLATSVATASTGAKPIANAVATGKPLSVLTLILNNCNGAYAVSVEDLSAVWYTNTKSLSSWFDTCSYGSVAFDQGAGNRMIQATGLCMNLDKCPDYSQVTSQALDAVKASRVVNTDLYRGYAGLGLKCPNAPHLWQLGWASAIEDFDIRTNMGDGQTRVFDLPVAVTEQQNFLRIRTQKGIYYVNHRRTSMPSEELPSTYNGRVIIYRYDFQRDDDMFTYVMQGLDEGETWTNGVFTVTVRSMTQPRDLTTIAQVAFCKPDSSGQGPNEAELLK
eukprot:gene9132-16257_t